MKDLPKIYDPKKFEQAIYTKWEKSGLFNPDKIKSKEVYCNVLPPPNANGELHLGHASGYTFMDIFGRYNRMNGKKTLLLPGKDHAGIQTQVVFEKILEKERGISRNELGREKFYQEIYDFCIDRSGYMRSQEKRIGISADWSREKFTLAPEVLKTALETFVLMHDDGLIYKGKRIINWCPRCSTALSDVEVLHKEKPGHLYYIKYPLENSTDFITVATTRPETMLGDTAVAVNPKDERYKNLVGKNVILPLAQKIIPIISDPRIDLEFGTGAVKITPAHDPLDWQIGKDHNLEEIQVINERAEITNFGGKYEGLTVIEARKKIIEDLQKLSLLEKTEEIVHSVSICERCKTNIEPLTSKQWFIKVESLTKASILALEKNQINIFPENFKKILTAWFENMHDWCISRQIWWGPQFPVWYCEECGEEKYIVSLEKPDFCPHCKNSKLTQDENTFDTWFTSNQWPYTTLKAKKGDFEDFYPTDMMIMGRDILSFWAARMIMMGIYKTTNVPFKNLFFTGLIRDKEGQKMSKSKGNGIDPLAMIDKFGADALRMSLVMDTAPGQDSRLYEEKIETFRNFVNKLWNISRYCLTQQDFKLIEKIPENEELSPADKWIIYKLNLTLKEINTLFENKQIAVAADILKTFTWNDFADWYLEINKNSKNKIVLGFVLDKLLKLWHPFMPFITEHIWETAEKETSLMISPWPKSDKDVLENSSFKDDFNFIEKYFKEIVISLRNIRAEKNIDPKKKLVITLFLPKSFSEKLFEKELESIKKIANLEKISLQLKTVENKLELKDCVQRIIGEITLSVSLIGAIDKEKENLKLKKEIENIEKFISSLESRLSDKEFSAKAPPSIIAGQKETLKSKKIKLAELKKLLTNS
jgi:valyl-tRNA synthetase